MMQSLLHQITPMTLVVMGTLVLCFGILLIAAIAYKRPAEPTERSIILILAATLIIITGIFMIMLSIATTFFNY